MQNQDFTRKSSFFLDDSPERTVSFPLRSEKETGSKARFNLNEKVFYQEVARTPAFVSPQRDQKIPELLTNADLLLKYNEKELAFHLIRQSLAVDSFHPEALKKLSRCFDFAKDNEKLIHIFSSLLLVDYGFQNVTQLAHAHYRQGQDKLAFERYQEALSILTDECNELFEVFKNMGNILVREGDFDGAEELYNKAFTLQPDSDVLLVNFGTLEVQRQDFAKALERFRGALEVNAGNDKAWVGLAMVHNSMGDQTLAKANLENALDINPKNRTATHLTANWAVRDLQYAPAIEALQNYLSYCDVDTDMSLLLIHLLCLSSKVPLALLEVERVLLWEPGNEQMLAIEKQIRQTLGA